jgi:hypothetical protein
MVVLCYFSCLLTNNYVANKNGQRMYIVEGFTFQKDSIIKCGDISWRCTSAQLIRFFICCPIKLWIRPNVNLRYHYFVPSIALALNGYHLPPPLFFSRPHTHIHTLHIKKITPVKKIHFKPFNLKVKSEMWKSR